MIYDSMLASPSTPSGGRPGLTVQQLQDTGQYVFQKKYDGVRVQLSWDVQRRTARLVSRHGADLTAQFPDIVDPVTDWALRTEVNSFTVDGELVAVRPRTLADLLRRVQSTKPGSQIRFMQTVPVQFVAFDVLHVYGYDYVAERHPLQRRLGVLRSLLGGGPVLIAHTTDDGVGQLEYVRSQQGEGIVAKRKDSRYMPGVRSWSWVKFKITYTVRAICYGPSGESGHGSMLAMVDDGAVRDVGSVGSGLRERDREALRQAWSQGQYCVALIDCLGVSTAGRLRQPVFKGFVDEPITSCDFSQQQELPVST